MTYKIFFQCFAIMNSNQKIIKFKFLRDIWKIVPKWIYEKMKNELLRNGILNVC